jgi:ABC-type branched-subunit amino acid transport system ATPase component
MTRRMTENHPLGTGWGQHGVAGQKYTYYTFYVPFCYLSEYTWCNQYPSSEYKFPGGIKQFLAIAHMLLKNSKILVLDEAIRTLDAECLPAYSIKRDSRFYKEIW